MDGFIANNKQRWCDNMRRPRIFGC